MDPNEYCLKYGQAVSAKVAECTAAVGLNVRAAPIATAPSLYLLMRKQSVRVVEHGVGGWVRLHGLRSEWCSSEWLHFTGETVAAIPPVASVPELTDAEKLARLWAAHMELHES